MTSISFTSSVIVSTGVPTAAAARAALAERVARLYADRITAPTQHLSPAPSRIRFSGLG